MFFFNFEITPTIVRVLVIADYYYSYSYYFFLFFVPYHANFFWVLAIGFDPNGHQTIVYLFLFLRGSDGAGLRLSKIVCGIVDVHLD